MGVGAGREQQSDTKAFWARDMNDQLIALLDRSVVTPEVRVGSNQRKVSHEFTAAAEFTGRREAHPVGVLPGDGIDREAQGRIGAMQMAPLRSAAHLDTLENLGLEGRAKALRRREATAQCGILQIRGGSDPRFLVDLAHPLPP